MNEEKRRTESIDDEELGKLYNWAFKYLLDIGNIALTQAYLRQMLIQFTFMDHL